MGDVRGFLKVKRQGANYRPVCERLKDHHDVCAGRGDECSKEQASRCMDCGTPFCHWACPVGNYIPEWNDLAFRGNWKEAGRLLCATNNLPEVTARLCPATCEFACVLGINDDPVTVRENELAVIEYAFNHGLIKANPPVKRSGKRVAVIGSGPAGLTCADQLNKAGHKVTVFERDSRPGGIMRFGIPDFKLEKKILERRLKIWIEEGIEFITGVNVGPAEAKTILKDFDAICLACGCRTPRDLVIEGRDLDGIHFAMDYLTQSNKIVAGENIPTGQVINAKGKQVLVIGGGDTGSDCVGTACRQQAACVTQIELLPQPPEGRTRDFAWPKYPVILKTTSSHEEGAHRVWSILTKKFIGVNGRVKKVSCVKVDVSRDNSGRITTREIPGTDFEIEADLVVLAMGFIAPEKKGPIEAFGLELDQRGNVRTDENYMARIDVGVEECSVPAKGIFACGDMRRGQSLVVWAISEGRAAAQYIDKYLMR